MACALHEQSATQCSCTAFPIELGLYCHVCLELPCMLTDSLLACLYRQWHAMCFAAPEMSDSGTPKYLDSDTPRHRHRKLQELKKQKRFGRQKCRWALWLPLSVLAIVAVSIYLKGRPSNVTHWAHISAPDKNLTYWYKVTPQYMHHFCFTLTLQRHRLSTQYLHCLHVSPGHICQKTDEM